MRFIFGLGIGLAMTTGALADSYLDVYASERLADERQFMPYEPPAGAYEPRTTGQSDYVNPNANRVVLCQTTSIGTACTQ